MPFVAGEVDVINELLPRHTKDELERDSLRQINEHRTVRPSSCSTLDTAPRLLMRIPILLCAGQHVHNTMLTQLLISRRFPLEARDCDGRTRLLLSARDGSYGAVQVLIDSGVDIEVARNDGGTPLSTAIYQERPRIVRFLLEKGAKRALPGPLKDEAGTMLEYATTPVRRKEIGKTRSQHPRLSVLSSNTGLQFSSRYEYICLLDEPPPHD
ncbi:uncharacterized protein B0T15DRAFT_522794 [Chaetomium strumarium]|uniref:Uncharacterized protein n=1 Tax=Chaetomium strumarium TaxID=1170767 RepID=A0AAJ0M3Q7_9PEZI|nr:hypothetical protein B0T15DRAFT_522794 [Chaetomium strumarium]